MLRAAILAIILMVVTAGTVLAFTWRNATVSPNAEAILRDAVAAEHQRVCGNALSFDTQLITVARYKVSDMGYRGYFGHAAPDGRRVWEFYARAGISYSASAEILAWNNYPDDLSPSAAFGSWMNSSTHRAAIRSCTYTRYGVGVFKIGSGAKYYAVEFTRP